MDHAVVSHTFNAKNVVCVYLNRCMERCKKCGEEPTFSEMWCHSCQRNYQKQYSMFEDHELNKTLTQISYQKYLRVRWKPPEERQSNPVSPRRPNQRKPKAK